MKGSVSFLIILVIGVGILGFMLQSDDFVTEDERWTEIRYTRQIFPDYGDYYPLEISFRSQGSLPKDLQSRYNYTGTVFISKYTIAANISDFRTVDKTLDKEMIGRDWKTIPFDDIELEGLEDATTIKFTVTLYPHNDSIGLTEDVYAFTVDLAKEAELASVTPIFVIVFLPIALVPATIIWHQKLNGYYLENINLKNLPKYTLKYPSDRFRDRFNTGKKDKMSRRKKAFLGIMTIIILSMIATFVLAIIYYDQLVEIWPVLGE